MEIQDHMKSDWSWYFCNRPPVDFDTTTKCCLFCSDLKSSSVRQEGSSDPYSSMWPDTEPARFKSCHSQSFAMDARIRLDHLKSGCKSPSPSCAVDGTLFNYSCQKETWGSDSKEEESALDLVELLNVEDEEQDEESWLYESPKKQTTEDKRESALRWCRHVLDNPSPEVEAACRLLISRLDESKRAALRGSTSRFHRRPVVFHHADTMSSSVDKSSTHSTAEGLDTNELSICHDSINSNYRLEDLTDVHIMARIQEASLRQDYVSTPAAASLWRGAESPAMLSSYSKTALENVDDFIPGSKTEAPSSSLWRPSVLSLSSSSSPASAAKRNCQSPNLVRLHQQVTQYKLLKLAQSQATSPGRTRSPARTSLRSLQAVRNSRSLEADGCHPSDQIVRPPSGLSSTKTGSSHWSPSFSAASMTSNVPLHSVRDSSARVMAMKKPQRSQSLSPCRIPHPAKGYLSVHGRVFASPERSTAVAWARKAPSTLR